MIDRLFGLCGASVISQTKTHTTKKTQQQQQQQQHHQH
jgi:hypothetical protein